MGEPKFVFNSRKTAQAAVFVLKRAGGSLTKGHLVKILYGADRRQIRRIGIPITGDTPFSMKNGPILSAVLDLLDGDKKDAFWSKHISTATKDTYFVKVLVDTGDDLLSENEKESLAIACDFLAKMSWEDVKAYFHDPKNIGEWENPGNSRKPISIERLYAEVGRPQKFVEELAMYQREEALIEKLLA